MGRRALRGTRNVRYDRIWPVLADLAYTLTAGIKPEERPTVPITAAPPQLLTVAQAASLLNVSDRTIRRWIEAEKIPYLKLPSGGSRIPQGALLASLRGNYDLAGELRELDDRHPGLSEDEVRRLVNTTDLRRRRDFPL